MLSYSLREMCIIDGIGYASLREITNYTDGEFLVKVILSSNFQLNFLSETKMVNGLKFKTRETATTTWPFYTRRHREHFNVRKTT